MVSIDDDCYLLVEIFLHEILDCSSCSDDIIEHGVSTIDNKAELLALGESSHRVRVSFCVLAISDVDFGVLALVVLEGLSSAHVVKVDHKIIAEL